MDEAECTLENLGDLCDEPVADACVRVPAGSFTFRLCMPLALDPLKRVANRRGVTHCRTRVWKFCWICRAYCPGGTLLPLAKPYFYIGKHQQLAAPTNAGQIEYQPIIESCDPTYACLNAARPLSSLKRSLEGWGSGVDSVVVSSTL